MVFVGIDLGLTVNLAVGGDEDRGLRQDNGR